MKKKHLVALLIGIVLVGCLGFVTVIAIRFERLQVFDWKGEQVISNGITYDYDMTLSAWTFTDRLPIEKTIGRIRGDKFWGFKTWILKIEGYDSDELVMLRGMMFDAIFVNKSTDND
ncbi:hypothetical protein J41TS12_12240 [Paenibacillus antibioticophila]|uniref:Lipoprotein n=1 Tax=Paenibacillus antibioticophila TaxID=1274374 RepID=A0A919XU06_9BACL|nr:hypothetical protein [Paenibacillus antibioticophila]GIO36363.1 hypothetical protein J41TS12_12240 [Paenibacillus antibioticophila]